MKKNLAFIYRDSKQFDKALALLQEIYKADPQHPDIRFEIAFVLLYMQKFDEAWDYYEYRKRSGFSRLVLEGKIPRYQGEDLAGKRLLVLGEQGFGDTILMLRFLPMLREKAEHVDVLVNPALHPLLRDLGVGLVFEQEMRSDAYDYCIEMMGLPRYFGKNWHRWPAQPALTVPEAALKKFSFIKNSLAPQVLRIGVVWSGSVTFQQNIQRSLSFDHFLDLSARYPQIQFYSFQKGPCETDLESDGRGSIIPLGAMFEDFSETAAALRQMDAIIMSDSAVAHLAGTFGVPVFNLLHHKPYWLYFPEEVKTALYPYWRFVRQKKPGDWSQVFADLYDMLDAVVKANAKKRLDAPALLKAADKVLLKKL